MYGPVDNVPGNWTNGGLPCAMFASELMRAAGACALTFEDAFRGVSSDAPAAIRDKQVRLHALSTSPSIPF